MFWLLCVAVFSFALVWAFGLDDGVEGVEGTGAFRRFGFLEGEHTVRF